MLPEPPVYEQDGEDPLTTLERTDTPRDQQQYPSKPDRAVLGSSPAIRRLQGGPQGAHRRSLERRTRGRQEVLVIPLRDRVARLGHISRPISAQPWGQPCWGMGCPGGNPAERGPKAI